VRRQAWSAEGGEHASSAQEAPSTQEATAEAHHEAHRAATEFRKSTSIQIACKRWHAGLSATSLLKLQAAVELLVTWSPVQVGTVFTGSDIVIHVLHAFAREWKIIFDKDVVFQARLQCESDEEVQHFLLNVFGEGLQGPHLFKDAAHLQNLSAFCERTKSEVVVPPLHMVVAGVVCVDRSPMNTKSSSMVNCVQNSSGETGESASLLLSFIDKCRPNIVLLECVKGLAQKVSWAALSDSEYISQEFASRNYGCLEATVAAENHGSQARRSRLYWPALKGQDIRLADVQTAIAETKIGKLPLECFIDKDAQEQEDFEFALEDELSASTRAAKRPKDAPKWQDFHMAMFLKGGLSWPPTSADWKSLPQNMTAAMESAGKRISERQKEILYYLEKTEPYACHGNPQWVNILHSMEFLVGQEATREAYSEEIPTLTTKAQIWMRQCDGDGHEECFHRLLSGENMMELIGWDRSYYNGSSDRFSQKLLTHLAGNAFSAFGIGPVLLATFVNLAGAGGHPRRAEEAIIIDEEGSDHSIDAEDDDR
jgi:site-specific DNA-cytosine methylase